VGSCRPKAGATPAPWRGGGGVGGRATSRASGEPAASSKPMNSLSSDFYRLNRAKWWVPSEGYCQTFRRTATGPPVIEKGPNVDDDLAVEDIDYRSLSRMSDEAQNPASQNGEPGGHLIGTKLQIPVPGPFFVFFPQWGGWEVVRGFWLTDVVTPEVVKSPVRPKLSSAFPCKFPFRGPLTRIPK